MRQTILLPTLAWLAFTALGGVAFFGHALWSDEAITLLLMAGTDPAAIAPGSYEPEALRAFYVDAAKTGPLDVWRVAAASDNHPPGYPALMAALSSLAGSDTLDHRWLRVLNVALSALFIVVALPLVRRLGARTGWPALVIVAFSPFAFYLARELRAYGLLLPLVLAAAFICLRLKDGAARARWLLAGLVAVNLAGCLLHKLFIGVIAAELAFFAAQALLEPARRRDHLALAAGVAIATLLVIWPIPNLFTAAPTSGAFETEWLASPRELWPIALSLLVHIAYLLSWWVTPPDNPLATPAGIAFAAAFAPLLLILLVAAAGGIMRRRPDVPTLLLFATPLAFLAALYVVLGVDLSKSPRFAVIWVPVAAGWLTARLHSLPYRRFLLPYAALAVAASSAFVLSGQAHTSPDHVRGFAAALPPGGRTTLVWLDNGALNAKGLLVALDAELRHAGKLPARYVLVAPDKLAGVLPAAGAQSGPAIIAASRRLRQAVDDACGADNPIVIGEYAACVFR